MWYFAIVKGILLRNLHCLLQRQLLPLLYKMNGRILYFIIPCSFESFLNKFVVCKGHLSEQWSWIEPSSLNVWKESWDRAEETFHFAHTDINSNSKWVRFWCLDKQANGSWVTQLNLCSRTLVIDECVDHRNWVMVLWLLQNSKKAGARHCP